MMKKTSVIAILSFIFFSLSCETNDQDRDLVEGTFHGTLSMENEGTKSYTQTEEAIAEIKKTGEFEIEVHCYSNSLDTIFRLNYFEHEENFKVCLTGSDFEDMYHTSFTGPMEMQNMHGASQWMNHLRTMHTQEDIHFGEFLRENKSFEYTFLMDHSSLPNMHFIGYRE